MSRNPNGVLINNDNIYGLVNPPPAPLASDKAKSYQDISSGAVRWDNYVDLSTNFTDLSENFYDLSENFYDLSENFYDLSINFTDLSNNGFSFQPASFIFSSIIEKIPYPVDQSNLWYNLYQPGQITFTQTKTFSKIKLWIKGRRGNVTGFGNSLKTQLPSKNVILNNPLTANWAGADITTPPIPAAPGNRDGLQNFYTTGIWDTGIAEGQGTGNNNGYDVWDISGPTKVTDPTGTGSTYALYEDISPNGWNLGWFLVITETAPDGTVKYLSNKMYWETGTSPIGIPIFFNPQAIALALSTDAPGSLPSAWAVPKLSKNKSSGVQSPGNYTNVKYSSWFNTPDYSTYGHVIHSMRTSFLGDNLWYCEKDLGYQIKNTTSGLLQNWVDVPITFTKGNSYLANICMTNMKTMVSLNPLAPAIGPGLGNIDAVTYLELIV